jgi:RNA polymerase sigma factor (sigma-70 family)
LDDSNDPDLALFKDLFWKELLAALDELPENQKQVFVWNELEDLTLQEIADQTGENLKTIISRKGYAVKHLRKKLAYLYQELKL